MDALDSVVNPLREFSKDSIRLVKRCHKPNRVHESRVQDRDWVCSDGIRGILRQADIHSHQQHHRRIGLESYGQAEAGCSGVCSAEEGLRRRSAWGRFSPHASEVRALVVKAASDFWRWHLTENLRRLLEASQQFEHLDWGTPGTSRRP
ncbi:uncharacterized protein LOC116255499 isoform X2 [Nymphaea colorata]|uniref:uncharacterized protein LOC116255499 isoform X2 n=1 Tax=Nymphaea colorata TaxID=210225 RepID=UPI00214F4BFF|nr:uncharacterized protein LOC116255499 isoform X2 [Nymphaea colorata]